MKEKLPKSAVIGVGVAGGRYLDALVQAGNPTAIFETNPSRRHEISQKYPDTKIFTDLSEITDWAETSYICTPDHLHVEPTIAALNAGNTVLCEKPVTTSLEDAHQLVVARKKNNNLFLVGNILRLTPTFNEVREMVRRGDLGELGSIRTTYIHDMRGYHKQTPWRESSQDYLYGGGIHALDLAYWIAGEKPSTIVATEGKKLIPAYLMPEDYQVLTRYESGLVAHMWANANARMQVHKMDLEVFGENGTLITDNRSGIIQFHQVKEGKTERSDITLPGVHTVPLVVAHLNERFLNQATEITLPDLEEAVKVIQIAAAAEKSIQKGSMPIKIFHPKGKTN